LYIEKIIYLCIQDFSKKEHPKILQRYFKL